MPNESDRKRAELAASDKLLPEMAFATRPLYGIPGVFVEVINASKTPYESVFTGRINPRQAEGAAHNLSFALRLQAFGPDVQMLESVHYEDALVERVAKWAYDEWAQGIADFVSSWEDAHPAARNEWLRRAKEAIKG